MRTIGVGVLGLIGGLLLAIVLQDILARILIDAGAPRSALGLIFGSLLPVLAVLGTTLAIWLDHRQRRPHSKDSLDD